MGNQQLLLIVLAMILVGIAIIVGIHMFSANAAAANLDAVLSDLLHLASRAQGYYLKPASMGGGNKSFKKITIEDITSKATNENGTYSLRKIGLTSVTIRGDGNLDGDNDRRKCRIEVRVFADSIATTILKR